MRLILSVWLATVTAWHPLPRTPSLLRTTATRRFHSPSGLVPAALPRPRLSAAVGGRYEQEEAAGTAWAQSNLHPEAACMCTEALDGISLSVVFWGLAKSMMEEGKPPALLLFPEADASFPLPAFADLICSLEIYGLNAVAVMEPGEGLPCPGMVVEAGMVKAPARISATDSVRAPQLMKEWVGDVVVDSRICPFTKSADVAATGLISSGIQPGAILYPVSKGVGSGGGAVVGLMYDFWDAVAQLLNAPPEEASTVLLCAPGFAVDDHKGFVAMTTAVVKNLKLIGAEWVVSLVFFHPLYDRLQVLPPDKPAHGHLPPVSWLRGYLRNYHSESEVEGVSEAELLQSNYQRRSPHTMINILRTEQVEAAEEQVPYEVIEVGNEGRRLRVSGAKVYASNVWRLATKSSVKQGCEGHSYLVTDAKPRLQPK